MFTFVTGGYRSGRSNYALRRASELGHPPWLYVATGQETDEAIRKRIEKYRRDAEAIWRTAVMPPRLEDLVEPRSLEGFGAAVFDGVATWIEAQLETAGEDAERAVLEEIGRFAERMYRSSVPIVVVSTEMGLGTLPQEAALQRLVKVVSSANQILAAQAGATVLMISGVPLKVR